MFFDERINRETNKIFSNAILYATIISTLYLIIKSFVFGFNFTGSISEIFIILTGIIIIIKDLVNFKNSVGDERIIEERMIYYKKASTVFLAMSLLGGI